MQWTEDLNALLNQCVFECGYDFTAASALLLSRARQLRLISGDERISLTSDECQVQWMEINPVVEDDDDDDRDGDGETEQHDLFLRRSSPSALYDDEEFQFYLQREDQVIAGEPVEIRPVETTCDGDATVEQNNDDTVPVVVDVPPGCPKLELSLSDADLDALLSSLPESHESHDHAVAEAKPQAHVQHTTSATSEMQWVLSFLTNPDAVANHDAEAKNLLFENADKAEDDQYQYFLHELGQANLLSPQKPDTLVQHDAASSSVCLATAASLAGREDDDSDDSDDDDWMATRKSLKTTDPAAVIRQRPAAASHKRRPLPPTSHLDVDLPPAAPVRFPPRSLSSTGSPQQPNAEQNDAVGSDDEDADSDDNGLDALLRYSPPVSTPTTLQTSMRDWSLHTPVNSAKRLALSHEIGHQLRKHGEFQFPKRLFRDPESDADHEQLPERDAP